MNDNTFKEVYFDLETQGLTFEIKVTNCNFDYSYDDGDRWTPPSSDFELLDVDFEISNSYNSEGDTVAWDKETHTEIMPLVHDYVDNNFEKFQ